MVIVLVSSEEPKREQKKLQIGIKKRIEDCAIKSRRGDLLHMHYTVGSRYACLMFISGSYLPYFTILHWTQQHDRLPRLLSL